MQSISPENIYRGNDAWGKALPKITKLTKSPLILGRSFCTHKIRNKIFIDLKNQNLNVNYVDLQFDCCYEDISRIKKIILNDNYDILIDDNHHNIKENSIIEQNISKNKFIIKVKYQQTEEDFNFILHKLDQKGFGENCFLGVNCTIENNTKIAKDNFIGAGSLIQKDSTEKNIYQEKQTDLSKINSHKLFRIKED